MSGIWIIPDFYTPNVAYPMQFVQGGLPGALRGLEGQWFHRTLRPGGGIVGPLLTLLAAIIAQIA